MSQDTKVMADMWTCALSLGLFFDKKQYYLEKFGERGLDEDFLHQSVHNRCTKCRS